MFSPQAMAAHLRATLASSDYRPPLLPSIALQLMELTRRPNVRSTEVRQLLERDSLLAARVLQLAQSALYSRGAPVRSLDEAISLLGLRTLGELFVQTVLSTRVFRVNGYEGPMAQLMRHSTVTAHVARLACRMTSIPDEYAFMCGLLHDVGMAAGLLIFAGPSQPGARKPGAPPPFEEVAYALEVVHEEAAAILAEAWRLHPEIRLVLSVHHRLQQGQHVHPLAAVVCVSDWAAAEAGAGIGGEADAARAELAASHLGFARPALQALVERARGIAAIL
jgi:HD-like signal output (HDOD) protein